MPCEASVPWYLGGRRAVRVERCGMVMRGYDVATQPLVVRGRRYTDVLIWACCAPERAKESVTESKRAAYKRAAAESVSDNI